MQNQPTALCGQENSSIHNTKHHNTRIHIERERERVASVVITVSHNQYEKSHGFTEKCFAPISDLNTKKNKNDNKNETFKKN